MVREQEDNVVADVLADAIYCIVTGEASMYMDEEKIKTNKYMSDQTTELSFGQKAVGLTFNPSGKAEVIAIKQKLADYIDYLNDLRTAATDGEVKRQYSVAITEAQTSQMWAVKAATWK